MQWATLTIFLGSFLLFLLQPVMGRTLLPVFGGSAAVWSVSLAAYQVLLLLGYLYTHTLNRRPGLVQRRLHFILGMVATLWLGLFVVARAPLMSGWGSSSQPALEVLICVFLCIGLPYLLLAAGSTLVQAWLAQSSPSQQQKTATSIYSLYAISNLGSFAGLLTFSLFLEPYAPLNVHWWILATGMAFYVALLTYFGRRWSAPAPHSPAPLNPPSTRAPLNYAWLYLPAITTFLLNATITHLFTDVSPIPLIWVIMLGLFLTSYIVGFSRWSQRWLWLWCLLTLGALFGAAWARGIWGTGSFYPNLIGSGLTLLLGGSLLHGWLFAQRPNATELTRYYLCIAIGGALGGLLAALVAPLIFKQITEYPLALALVVWLVAWRWPAPRNFKRPTAPWRLVGASVLVLAWLFFLQSTAHPSHARTIYSARNFYSPVRVTQTLERLPEVGIQPVHYLWCGQTTHGVQVRSPLYQGRGVSYYGASGAGIAFASYPKSGLQEGRKVGIIGLGAGCLAEYGRAEDLFRFYEINPLMVAVATNPALFSFLPQATAPIDLIPGDARKMLEREHENGDPLYDILVIDAYSGDSVPYHLITHEAFALYLARLADEGILAVHISNWHVDLLPICKAVGQSFGLQLHGVMSRADGALTADALWVFMTRRPLTYHTPPNANLEVVDWGHVRSLRIPTDERGSLLPLLRSP